MLKTLYQLPYGRGAQSVDLKNHNVLDVLRGSGSNLQSALPSEEALIRDALDHPIGRPVLKKLLQPGESVCIVISDMTRSWQRMHVFLPILVERINEAGVEDKNIQFVCATGSHRAMTEDEAKVLLGPQLHTRFNVISHDCRDESNLVAIGTTSRGTVVKLNRLAMEADHLIITGGIVFHDLAGWGGGKKSILPGIAGYDSIMTNHSLSLGDRQGSGIHPNIRCGNIEGNRLNADMEEAAAMVNPAFMLNVIVNEDSRISGAVAGHYLEAFEEGKKLLDQAERVSIDRLADFALVSAGGFPKDIDFYQATKALSSAREAVKKGGVILLMCQCEEGIGHPEVSDLLMNHHSHADRENEMRRAFTVSKFAGFLASQMAEDYQVYCVTDLEAGILEGIGFRVFRKASEALAEIERKHGTLMNTYVIPSASSVLPGLTDTAKS